MYLRLPIVIQYNLSHKCNAGESIQAQSEAVSNSHNVCVVHNKRLLGQIGSVEGFLLPAETVPVIVFNNAKLSGIVCFCIRSTKHPRGWSLLAGYPVDRVYLYVDLWPGLIFIANEVYSWVAKFQPSQTFHVEIYKYYRPFKYETVWKILLVWINSVVCSNVLCVVFVSFCFK
jgi:hypothetical protein